jgi:Bacterial regulatory proteins, luxR family
VLWSLCEGLSQAQTARRLGISPATERCHVHHLFEKLGAATTAQAASFYLNPDLSGNARPRALTPAGVSKSLWPKLALQSLAPR